MTRDETGSTPAPQASHRPVPSGYADRAAKALLLLGILVMGGIVAAHLGLLNRGAWEPDEYAFIAAVRDDGAKFFWDRLRGASPRPLSEALIVLYAWAVIAVRQPLIVPALLLPWAGFLAAALPTFTGGRPAAPRVLGTMAVVAFMLLGHGAFEVFYWPVGAVAYLPVLSAALFLLFSLANEHWCAKPVGAIAAAVLVAAAWSAEAGALLVLCFFAALLATAVVARAAVPARLAWSAPLLAAALVVGLALTNGRLLAAIGIQAGDPALIHHWLASAIQAARRGTLEFLAADAETFDPPHLLTGLAIKALFFAGVHLCWLTSGPEARCARRFLPPLALALLATAFATLTVGYWNNGTACCERHNLLRQDFGFLALAAIAIWLPPLISAGRLRAAAPVLLIAAAALAIAPRARDLALDYRFWSEPARARALSWSSGFSPGPDMVLYQSVPDALFDLAMPPGTWRMGDTWWVHGVLRFFGKTSVRTVLAGSHVGAREKFPE
jgi:hypothetical protein